MVVYQVIFTPKFGHGPALLKHLVRWAESVGADSPGGKHRFYTDVEGPLSSIVWEQEFEDLREWVSAQESVPEHFRSPEYQEWYQRLVEMVEHGEHKLLGVTEVTPSS